MARRTSLREYQIAVAERLRTVSLQAAAASKLGFMVAETRWIMNLNEVAEVLPVPRIVSIPLTKSYFLGMCNVRGNLYGVLDFAAYMDKAPVAPTVESRLLLLPSTVVQGAAVLVSRMAGLRSVESFLRLESDPDAPAWLAGRYRDSDGQIWSELAVAGLTQHERFLNVGL
jgi:twitching motility protein PilI